MIYLVRVSNDLRIRMEGEPKVRRTWKTNPHRLPGSFLPAKKKATKHMLGRLSDY